MWAMRCAKVCTSGVGLKLYASSGIFSAAFTRLFFTPVYEALDSAMRGLVCARRAQPPASDMVSKTMEQRFTLGSLLLKLCLEPQFVYYFSEIVWPVRTDSRAACKISTTIMLFSREFKPAGLNLPRA